jgi:hypothetical protein
LQYPPPHTALAAFGVLPHACPGVHVAVLQSFDGVHCAGVRHCTQAPLPSQYPVAHVTPDPLGMLPHL